MKEHGPDTVKVYGWIPGATLAMTSMFSDELEHVARMEAERRGIPLAVAAYEVSPDVETAKVGPELMARPQMLNTPVGRVLNDSVNPPIYDYELHPQAVSVSLADGLS